MSIDIHVKLSISIIHDVDGLSCQNWKIIINDPSIAPLGREWGVMSADSEIVLEKLPSEGL